MARPIPEAIRRKALRARDLGESPRAIALRYGVAYTSILRWAVGSGRKFLRPWKITDELTDIPISRQRKKQLRSLKNGRCPTCGEPAVTNYHCLRHAIKNRERQRYPKGDVRRLRNALTYNLQRKEEKDHGTPFLA